MIGEKRLGLCLSAGGAKGLAHIGVLKVLEKYNIPIHSIAGTSSGALVGGLYSSTENIEAIEELALSLTKKKWMSLMLKDLRLFKKGLVTGDTLMKFLGDFIDNLEGRTTIGAGHHRLKIVAADILTGKREVFGGGPILEAVRASISLPLTFTPAELYGRLFVDGACIDPAPVDIPVTMRSNKVLLIATCGKEGLPFIGKLSKANILHNYSMNSTATIIRERSKLADLTLWPEVDDIDTLEFWKAKEAIAAGEKVAEENINKIKELVSFWRN